ncbi:MAG: methyl-accepting chemotaxis protein [Treponema sp.]|nr:methyl-accepting chemotaxis protein [Treponema sp.]
MAARTSIKRRLLFFSLAFFLVIFIGGSAAFALSRWQIAHANAGHELSRVVEIEQVRLEASVNGEIAIALKMADSPLIKRHFLDPGNEELRRIAFEEIAGYQQAFASKAVFWASDTDREFYFDAGNHYTIDPEDPDNYWYKMTLYETKKFNFNINYNSEMQRIMLWINAPVFDARHTPIGLVGTGIDLSEFVNAIYKGYTDKAALYFFNSLGEITGAQDMELITKKVTITDELGSAGAEILEKANNMEDREIHYFNTSGGEVALVEIPSLKWYITAILPITIWDSLDSPMTVIFMAMMVVIALIFIVFYFFITGLVKPLNVMVTTLDKISEDWDMTRRLKVRHKDETGILAEFFNLTFEKISILLKGIKNKAFTLSDTGDELNATMDETSLAITKIDTEIQKMREMVLSQADEVNNSTVSIEQIIKELDNLNNHITVQAENVSQSSAAIEQMLASIRSVTETLIKNSSNINSLTESSETGRNDLQKVSEDIQEIAHESEGLLEINSVMQNIASQTNLLSMNAAIEAAHAGESGKGFAVVADEIRKLAENSSNQSKTISTVLKKIKTSIDAITKSTSVVLERFSTIEREVNIVSNQETQIRSAMQEQENGSQQILEAIMRLNSVTSEVQKASSDMAGTSKEVLNQSTNLKRISGEVAGEMDDMTQNAEMITSAVTRVLEISQENKENISSLTSDIGRFKVE